MHSLASVGTLCVSGRGHEQIRLRDRVVGPFRAISTLAKTAFPLSCAHWSSNLQPRRCDLCTRPDGAPIGHCSSRAGVQQRALPRRRCLAGAGAPGSSCAFRNIEMDTSGGRRCGCSGIGRCRSPRATCRCRHAREHRGGRQLGRLWQRRRQPRHVDVPAGRRIADASRLPEVLGCGAGGDVGDKGRAHGDAQPVELRRLHRSHQRQLLDRERDHLVQRAGAGQHDLREQRQSHERHGRPRGRHESCAGRRRDADLRAGQQDPDELFGRVSRAHVWLPAPRGHDCDDLDDVSIADADHVVLRVRIA